MWIILAKKMSLMVQGPVEVPVPGYVMEPVEIHVVVAVAFVEDSVKEVVLRNV